MLNGNTIKTTFHQARQLATHRRTGTHTKLCTFEWNAFCIMFHVRNPWDRVRYVEQLTRKVIEQSSVDFHENFQIYRTVTN